MLKVFVMYYMDQFLKVKIEMVVKFVVFVLGVLVIVLVIVFVFDFEFFFGFEIILDCIVFFYMVIFGSIWVVVYGMQFQDDVVFDLEYVMCNVIEYIYYEFDYWKDRFYSYDIKLEFVELYKFKIVIFLEEILGILIMLFVFFFSFFKCSDQIIDFFWEFMFYIDGLGYVCIFVEFDFKKVMVNVKKLSDGGDVCDEYYLVKYGKMEVLYYGFIGNYGNFVFNLKGVLGLYFLLGMWN